MSPKSRRIGLKWKISGIYTSGMLILGMLISGAVYQLAEKSLRDQLDKRAMAVAINLSDGAAGNLASKNLLALNTLARKYTLLDSVAYAYVENDNGEIVAHTFGTFPEELRQEAAASGGRQAVLRRELTLENRVVHEAAAPILEGRMGIARVGFWADSVQTEIRQALLPVVGIVGLVPLVRALFSFVLAHWIVRPIVGLTAVAEKMTCGDLNAVVDKECLKSRDEIGDLARSLERMRTSLKAAMERLNRKAA